jgi:drug/metabolite transporter (DMT)-like permease
MQVRHLYLTLFIMGATWGVTPVLVKIAVSSGHHPFGLIVWINMVGVILSGVVTFARGRRLPMSVVHLKLYLGISLLGTVIPNLLNFTAAVHLPAGIMSILVALVPMFAMPIALVMGFEKPSILRFLGALCGTIAIILIVGPDTGLPDASKIGFVFVALGASLCYGGEGNFLTWFGMRGLDPVQVLFGASVIGLVIAVPLAGFTGNFIPLDNMGVPELALIADAIISWGTYATYIWVIGRAGPVFASQVAYLVTGFGVVWAMLLLGERYSIWVWMAFALMLVGIALVKPHESK